MGAVSWIREIVGRNLIRAGVRLMSSPGASRPEPVEEEDDDEGVPYPPAVLSDVAYEMVRDGLRAVPPPPPSNDDAPLRGSLRERRNREMGR